MIFGWLCFHLWISLFLNCIIFSQLYTTRSILSLPSILNEPQLIFIFLYNFTEILLYVFSSINIFLFESYYKVDKD